MAKESFPYVIAEALGKNRLQYTTERNARRAKLSVEKGYESARARAESEAEPVSEELQAGIDGIKAWYTEYFQSLGVENPHLDNLIFESDTLKEMQSGEGCAERGILFVRKTIKDLELAGFDEAGTERFQQFVKLRTIAHEMYHNTAPRKYRMVLDENKDYLDHVEEERRGLHYLGKSTPPEQVTSSAYEEGLAEIMETQTTEAILQHIPGGQEQITAYLDEVVEKGLFEKIEVDGVPVVPIRYPDSVKLVAYLHTQLNIGLTNMRKLEEEARINHQTLPLARAIENKFGQGSYRKIMETSDDHALELIDELEMMRIRNNLQNSQN